jgi:hypothetical protein
MYHGVFIACQPASGERLMSAIEPGKFYLPADAPVDSINVTDAAESGIHISNGKPCCFISS